MFLLLFYFPLLSIYVYYFVLLCFVISIYSNRAELSHFFGHEVLPLEIKLVGAGNQIVAVAKVDCSPLSSAIGAKEFHGAELEGKTNSKKYIFFQISKNILFFNFLFSSTYELQKNYFSSLFFSLCCVLLY